MDKFRNDKQFWDNLELLEDFLQWDADVSHVGRLVHHYKNCLKIAAGDMGVMHVASALAVQPSRVLPNIADVPHVICTIGFGAISLSYVLCAFCIIDRQDLGLSVVYLCKAAPRCIQTVLECGVKNALSSTKAAMYLNERYPTAGADGAARCIVRGMGSCTKGCADAPRFDDKPQKEKEAEAVPLIKLRSEDA